MDNKRTLFYLLYFFPRIGVFWGWPRLDTSNASTTMTPIAVTRPRTTMRSIIYSPATSALGSGAIKEECKLIVIRAFRGLMSHLPRTPDQFQRNANMPKYSTSWRLHIIRNASSVTQAWSRPSALLKLFHKYDTASDGYDILHESCTCMILL